ncbi:MAG: MFS transporter, partial [Clostridia bacterium]|nr:MFS transporter [Clostridia bacterium]
MSFLVYEETSSTLASALIVALRVVPGLIIPLTLSPLMDRLPRKPFLVGCDALAALIYVAAGLFLRNHSFEYIYYLLFSLVISTLGSIDEMSYNAIFPKVIPSGAEEKGYSVSSMLYPMLMVVMTPLSAVMYKYIGVSNILIGQGVLCLLTSITENKIKVHEEIKSGTDFSLAQWWGDLKEATAYMKREKGLMAMTVYSGTTNGMFAGYEPLMVAFFSSMPGFTIGMYSFFTVVEFIGRTIGGIFVYKKEMPKEKKYPYSLFVYLTYDTMDACLLWLPYPLMLVNRAICGYLGIQSGTMRYAAVQKYI